MTGTGNTSDTLEAAVLSALSGITVGEGGPDVVSAGHVSEVAATSGVVRVLIDPALVDPDQGEALSAVLSQVVGVVPGVERVVVKPRPQPIASLLAQAPGAVLAVHSGKGGVGKSTIAANLAVALAHGATGRRMRVGLLDADVYGPSAPLLLGASGRAGTTADGARIAPLEAHGIRVMSLGFLMPEGKALAWRGALVDEGLPQLIADVDWGDLDALVVDLPPGTSDVHLALARAVLVAGVVTVTAPGRISTDDVRRGMEMFADIAIPCLGLIENMSTVACCNCGAEHELFGAGGAEELAGETGVPVLARIPFLRQVLLASESGVPLVLREPGAAFSQRIIEAAGQLAPALALNMTGGSPWRLQ
ncbi:MAG: Mrp/NBP35 family ATP-binding protein [Paracoccaceae bacterium]